MVALVGVYLSTILHQILKNLYYGNYSDHSVPYKVLKLFVIYNRTNVKDSDLLR
ncbi:hypothetical protein BLA29_010000 [Euroglyphus maynei]|uniref:Uncharacterized protein n=1 Tax=Euroglyphus maynei TaxID=6958 RepID=A0A1Y3B078_EURMA|nr:hypothetical protein BLA29_010000 [Euroglyphus maynei]